MSKNRKKRQSNTGNNFDSFLTQFLRSKNISMSGSRRREFLDFTMAKFLKLFEEERNTKYVMAQNRLSDAPIAFPNGKKSVAYCHTVALEMEDYADLYFEGLEQSGLEADINPAEGTITLHGTPAEARAFDLTLCAKLKGWEPGDDILKRNFNIAINPDPRDLWKDIPVPADLPFQKDDSANAYVLVKEFEGVPQKDIVAASKRGRSHAHEGKPRDDDFRVSFNPQNGWYVLVVADGAGSAKYSREGSRIACEVAEQYCKEQLAERLEECEPAFVAYVQEKTNENIKPAVDIINSIIYAAAKAAHKAIEQKVEECGEQVVMRDFSTTLLITICRKFDFGWLMGSFGVGDGAIAIYDKDADKVQLLNDPDSGDYAGQTRFLTNASVFGDRPRAKITVVPDFTALMLMTDGVSDPFFDTDANLIDKDKWDTLWDDLSAAVDFSDDNENAKNQLLSWLDFYKDGYHDDRTIAILY